MAAKRKSSKKTGRKRSREPKSSVRRVRATVKQLKAMELRIAGHTLEEIAQKLRYKDASSAYRAIMAGMIKTIQEPADELRKVHIARCEKMISGKWDDATTGDDDAIQSVLRIMKREAKLLGLDAPEKREHSGTIGVEGEVNVDHSYKGLEKLLKDKDFRSLASSVLSALG